jgi:hypothetical protein
MQRTLMLGAAVLAAATLQVPGAALAAEKGSEGLGLASRFTVRVDGIDISGIFGGKPAGLQTQRTRAVAQPTKKRQR